LSLLTNKNPHVWKLNQDEGTRGATWICLYFAAQTLLSLRLERANGRTRPALWAFAGLAGNLSGVEVGSLCYCLAAPGNSLQQAATNGSVRVDDSSV